MTDREQKAAKFAAQWKGRGYEKGESQIFWAALLKKEQRAKIEKTAQAILEARKCYPDKCLADMYGETMYLFPALLTAHQNNDRAVWEAYGEAWNVKSESACVAALMRMYQQLAEKT